MLMKKISNSLFEFDNISFIGGYTFPSIYQLNFEIFGDLKHEKKKDNNSLVINVIYVNSTK